MKFIRVEDLPEEKEEGYICTHCSHWEEKEAEIICWKCHLGEMVFQSENKSFNLCRSEVLSKVKELDVEKLASHCHFKWSGWMRYLFSKCEFDKYDSYVIPEWAVKRWSKQMETPYKDLSEKEKESDRDEARAIIKSQGKGGEDE